MKPLYSLFIIIALTVSCKKDVEIPKTEALPIQLTDAFGMAVPHLDHSRDIDILTRYEMGVRWVRRDIAWDRVERTKDQFDFSQDDDVIDREIKQGIQILGILDYGNTIYNTSPDATTAYPPDTLAYFCNFVKHTVLHFKDRIKVWEIWNEPNGPTFWKPSANPKAYGELALLAAKCIKETDPSAKVMLGGMVGNSDPVFFGLRPWGFTEDLFNYYPELSSVIDIYAVHPYTFLQHPIPEAPTSNPLHTGFIDMLKNFRQVIDRAGGHDKPIWITEMGWHSAIHSTIFDGVPEDMQAANLVRASVLAISMGIEKIFPYTYVDGFEDLSVSEAHFGMMRPIPNAGPSQAYIPKPAYYAYKTLTKILSDKKSVIDLHTIRKLQPYIYAYQFDNIIVAWTIDEDSHLLSLEQKPKSILNLYGENIVVENENIAISKLPIFIEL